MRISSRFLLLLFPVLAVVIFGFVFMMNRVEQQWVLNDLNNRARLVSDSIQEFVLASDANAKPTALKKYLNRISRDSRLFGAIVCDSDGKVLGKSDSVPKAFKCADLEHLVKQPPSILFFDQGDKNVLHRAAYSLLNSEGAKIGTVAVLHDPSYMNRRSELTRRYAIFSFLGLGMIVSFSTLLVYRWSVSRPLAQLSETMKAVLSGDVARLSRKRFENTELAPLVKDLDQVLLELRKAQLNAGETVEASWNPARLRKEVQRLFGDSRLCVIANREPYVHNRRGSKIEVMFPASGLVSAVEPIVRACSGLWIGHGSGSADRETADKRGTLLVPPGKPEYALKRVWLTRAEEQGYYYGFSNEGLWPLCHIAHTRPIFRLEDWQHYINVNAKFAQAFNEEMTSQRPIALIQDYHFAVLPGMLRKLRPDAVTSLFWHIPWPNPEVIAICPWKNELLEGMLGADLIGFHTQYHCNNFLDTVDRFLEARVERDRHAVTFRGHTCYVKPFPISIEWPSRHEGAPEKIPQIRSELLEEIALPQDALVGVGVDRVDYTKGILERFLAVERMLEKYPEMVGKFVFIQIGAPSRTHIKSYQDLNSEVQEVADRINWRFHQDGYEPILLRLAHHDAGQVFRFYQAADVCYVSSLHDGMNLVAKEYIAARSDCGGALVLSSFTGAARELKEALIVNPYDIEESAEALYKALTMSDEERRERMSRLRATVAQNNVYAWAGQFLAEVSGISEQRAAGLTLDLQGANYGGGEKGSPSLV